MLSQWIRLVDFTNEELFRGDLIRFPSKYPFETEVVMMIAESPSKSGLCLITITGYKAGINCFQEFPSPEIEMQVPAMWLIKNWNKWIYTDCQVEDVMIRRGLKIEDFVLM